MKECPSCHRCFKDEDVSCPEDGASLFFSLHGEPLVGGRYVLEQWLGKGSMGTVYAAHHLYLRTSHAIKAILPDSIVDPELTNRFRQEAAATAAIHHPNVATVSDFGIDQETLPFLVMELVDGVPLDELLRKHGRFDQIRAFEIFDVICSAVGAGHAIGVMHGDLKARNIFLPKSGSVTQGLKVLDFGLAKIKFGEHFGAFLQARSSNAISSWHYTAPERWSDAKLDARADVYSLGVLLYQLMSGKLPFDAPTAAAMMRKHQQDSAPALATVGVTVSAEIEGFIQTALAKQPEQRFASLQAMRAAAAQFMQATTIVESAQAQSASAGATTNIPASMRTQSNIVPTMPPVTGRVTTALRDNTESAGTSRLLEDDEAASRYRLAESKRQAELEARRLGQARRHNEGEATDEIAQVAAPTTTPTTAPTAAPTAAPTGPAQVRVPDRQTTRADANANGARTAARKADAASKPRAEQVNGAIKTSAANRGHANVAAQSSAGAQSAMAAEAAEAKRKAEIAAAEQHADEEKRKRAHSEAEARRKADAAALRKHSDEQNRRQLEAKAAAKRNAVSSHDEVSPLSSAPGQKLDVEGTRLATAAVDARRQAEVAGKHADIEADSRAAEEAYRDHLEEEVARLSRELKDINYRIREKELIELQLRESEARARETEHSALRKLSELRFPAIGNGHKGADATNVDAAAFAVTTPLVQTANASASASSAAKPGVYAHGKIPANSTQTRDLGLQAGISKPTAPVSYITTPLVQHTAPPAPPQNLDNAIDQPGESGKGEQTPSLLAGAISAEVPVAPPTYPINGRAAVTIRMPAHELDTLLVEAAQAVVSVNENSTASTESPMRASAEVTAAVHASAVEAIQVEPAPVQVLPTQAFDLASEPEADPVEEFSLTQDLVSAQMPATISKSRSRVGLTALLLIAILSAGAIVVVKYKPWMAAISGPATQTTGAPTVSDQATHIALVPAVALVSVPAGQFTMGGGTQAFQLPAHKVTIPSAFFIGKYEITQAEWRSLMGSNPSTFIGDTLPVENVAWNDAQEFVRRLNLKHDGYTYRLPSEAEWEYAARAGSASDANPAAVTWSKENSKASTHAVGTRQPNAFGIFDMQGNVFEWCADGWHAGYDGAPADGSAWTSTDPKPLRVIRGGSWDFPLSYSSVSARNASDPTRPNSRIGFRIVAERLD